MEFVMPLEPTDDNLRRMRILCLKGIRTVEIPLPPSDAKWHDGIVRPVSVDIETEKINVDEWLAWHDPLWKEPS